MTQIIPAAARFLRWIRRIAALFALLLVTAAGPAAAQHAEAAALAPSAPAAVAAPAGPASVDELDRLVRTLQDNDGRARLVEQLRALIAAQRGVEAKEPDAATILGNFSRQIDATSGEILAGVAMVVDAPRLLAWAQRQISDSAARDRWIEVALKLAAVFAVAFSAEWIVRRFMPGRRGSRPRLEAERRATRLARLVEALLGLVLRLLPLLAFALVAYAVLPMIFDGYSSTRRTLSILVHATVAARLLLCIAQTLLVPRQAGTSLVPAEEETRLYLHIWAKRFIYWGVFGYAVPEAAWWLGIPGGVYALMLKGVGLVLAVLAIIFILQNRAPLGAWIGGSRRHRARPIEDALVASLTGESAATSDGSLAGSGTVEEAVESEISEAEDGAGWRLIRRRVGETWHVLAITYIVAIYLIYALRVEGGFGFILRSTALSLVILAAARLLVRLVRRLSRRGFAVAPDLRTRFPGLEHRANRYVPILTGLTSIIIYVLAFLTLLQAWDIAAFSWFGSSVGRRMTGILVSVGAVLIVALIVWEVLAAAIERYLHGTDASGAPRSARIRTLLPLLRTTLLCVIVVMAALIIMSEIGIDIAPLLAGAGVVGIAVGFGSQALVKDIITGLFILIEDQFAVGDIVNVGKDHQGTVEAITIRTIRLRDVAGTVHTVPFSEVTTVKNLTRDFAYVVARIGIGYGEDIDRVVDILRAAAAELAADEACRPFILDPFEYLGVDRLDDFAVILLLRIRTTAKKQFVIGRAFNRLVKIAFEKNGVVWRDPAAVQFSAQGGSPFEPASAARPDAPSALPA